MGAPLFIAAPRKKALPQDGQGREQYVNKRRKNRAEDGGHDTGDGDGEAAHGAFDLPHLQGLTGADGVGGGTNADAARDGVGDVADLADSLSHQRAEDAR